MRLAGKINDYEKLCTYVKRFLSAPFGILGLIIHFHKFEVHERKKEKTSRNHLSHIKNETLITMTPSGERALPQKLR